MRAQICLRVGMNNEFIIPLNGLAAGKNAFSWQADREFFVNFENAEVLDAQLDIDAFVEKSGRYVGVDCEVDGHVTVECDRCLEDLDLPVEVDIRLSVKYGDEESSEEHQEGEREIVFVPEGDAEFDMSQIVYDYVCLSLPMQRHHEEGDCNEEALRHLSGNKGEEAPGTDENNPFAALKGMFK